MNAHNEVGRSGPSMMESTRLITLFQIGCVKITLIVAIAILALASGCDSIAPNESATESLYKSKDNLEVRITVQPKTVRSGQVFYITVLARNAGTVPIAIAAPFGGGSGGVPMEYTAQHAPLKFMTVDGRPNQLSDGNSLNMCTRWAAPERIGNEVRRTLVPGEELVNCRLEYVARSAADGQSVSPGKYRANWSPEITIRSPTSEALLAFTVDFDIAN